MKLGGYDFIKKPFELDEIVAAVRNAARTHALDTGSLPDGSGAEADRERSFARRPAQQRFCARSA